MLNHNRENRCIIDRTGFSTRLKSYADNQLAKTVAEFNPISGLYQCSSGCETQAAADRISNQPEFPKDHISP